MNIKHELKNIITSTNKKIKSFENESTTFRPEKEKIQKQVDALQIINQGIIQKQDDLLKQLQEAKGIFENILL